MLLTATASHLWRAPRAYQIHTKPSFRTLPSVPPSYLAHNTRDVRRNQQKRQQTGHPDLCGAVLHNSSALQNGTAKFPLSIHRGASHSSPAHSAPPERSRSRGSHSCSGRVAALPRASRELRKPDPEAPGRTGVKAGASSASRAPPEAAPGAAPPRKAPPRKAPLAQGSGGRAAAAPRFRRRGAAQQSCRPPPLGGRGRENGGGGRRGWAFAVGWCHARMGRGKNCGMENFQPRSSCACSAPLRPSPPRLPLPRSPGRGALERSVLLTVVPPRFAPPRRARRSVSGATRCRVARPCPSLAERGSPGGVQSDGARWGCVEEWSSARGEPRCPPCPRRGEKRRAGLTRRRRQRCSNVGSTTANETPALKREDKGPSRPRPEIRLTAKAHSARVRERSGAPRARCPRSSCPAGEKAYFPITPLSIASRRPLFPLVSLRRLPVPASGPGSRTCTQPPLTTPRKGWRCDGWAGSGSYPPSPPAKRGAGDAAPSSLGAPGAAPRPARSPCGGRGSVGQSGRGRRRRREGGRVRAAPLAMTRCIPAWRAAAPRGAVRPGATPQPAPCASPLRERCPCVPSAPTAFPSDCVPRLYLFRVLFASRSADAL